MTLSYLPTCHSNSIPTEERLSRGHCTILGEDVRDHEGVELLRMLFVYKDVLSSDLAIPSGYYIVSNSQI